MYSQCNLKVIYKSAQETKRTSNYYDFSSEELHCKKRSQMFEFHNLIASMKVEAVNF
jgi:hypothetical protein